VAYSSFEELEVWKRACRVAVEIYEMMKDCRDFGLKDQITRSAVSIASNIAEGAERDSKPEFIRVLNIAKGSAAELRTQLYIAQRIGTLTPSDTSKVIPELKQISAMLQGLIKSIRSQLKT
jgi:four helix bundle protein